MTSDSKPLALKALVVLNDSKHEIVVQTTTTATVADLVAQVSKLTPGGPHDLSNHIVKCGSVVATDRTKTLKDAGLTYGRLCLVPSPTADLSAPSPIPAPSPVPTAAPPAHSEARTQPPRQAPQPAVISVTVGQIPEESEINPKGKCRDVKPVLKAILERVAGNEASDIVAVFCEHSVYTLEDARDFVSSQGRNHISISLRSKILSAISDELAPLKPAPPVAPEASPVAQKASPVAQKAPPVTPLAPPVSTERNNDHEAQHSAQILQLRMMNETARRNFFQSFDSDMKCIYIEEENARQKIIFEKFKHQQELLSKSKKELSVPAMDYIYVEVALYVQSIDKQLKSIEVYTQDDLRITGVLSAYGVQYGDKIRIKIALQGGF